LPNPKRRHSNQRTRKRRTHDKVTPAALALCPECGAHRRPHHICPRCGHYNGRPVVTVRAKETQKSA
jgi:large subunit ribosomal protein L32